MSNRLVIIILIALLAGGYCFAQTDQSEPFTVADDGQWLKTDYVHRLSQFPKVHPDGRFWFQFKAPDTAKSVKLEIGGGSHEMQKDSQGLWNVVIPRPAPGFKIYSFDVDGTSFIDPGTIPFY